MTDTSTYQPKTKTKKNDELERGMKKTENELQRITMRKNKQTVESLMTARLKKIIHPVFVITGETEARLNY